jgi:hypothetical protein
VPVPPASRKEDAAIARGRSRKCGALKSSLAPTDALTRASLASLITIATDPANWSVFPISKPALLTPNLAVQQPREPCHSMPWTATPTRWLVRGQR